LSAPVSQNLIMSRSRLVQCLGLVASYFAVVILSLLSSADDLPAQVYFLPDTPNGLKPTQSWDAVGPAPSGDIYVAGMDHVSNAALYRFRPSTGVLEYVGDARSASEAATNWLPGEVVEKFHTRPLWYGGKVYVASLNYSSLDGGYLQTRGFKWYAYDEASGVFSDLSAGQPGGTAIPQGGVVALTLSPVGQKFYAMTVPTAEVVSYGPVSNLTAQLGRPAQFDEPYVYSARFMWVDSRGRLYLSAGNGRLAPDDPSVFGHMYFFDPGQGFGQLPGWALVNTTAIQSGQWSLNRDSCYMMDDQANVFQFGDAQSSFGWIGQGPAVDGGSWVFQLTANQRKIYIIEGYYFSQHRLFEFDIQSGQSHPLCSLTNLAPSITLGNICGYNSWDNDGRFYVTSGNNVDNVVFFQIDPVLLKITYGFLPSLTQVQLFRSAADPASFTLTRDGDTNSSCLVVYSARVPYDPGVTAHFYFATIPAGQSSIDLSFPRLLVSDGSSASVVTVDLIPDGDTYKVGTNRSLSISIDAINQSSVVSWAGYAGGLADPPRAERRSSAWATDGGSTALFNQPSGVAADLAGNLYVADSGNNAIRKVTSTGDVITLCGLVGSSGSADGIGTNALFNFPVGIAVDGAGSVIYVADTDNHTIRRLDSGGAVTTVAGLAGSSGSADGAGINARFFFPQGVVLSPGGDLYVADTFNQTLRKITGAGDVSTVAGSAGVPGLADGPASTARFDEPQSLALATTGNLYVADRSNNLVRALSVGGQVSTLAGQVTPGSADGLGSSAQFTRPEGVGLDASANLYVADSANHTIRKVSASGLVTTVGGKPGAAGMADGLGSLARFNSPAGLAIGPDGSIYVADTGNNRIVKGSPLAPLLAVEQPPGTPISSGASTDFGSVPVGSFGDTTFVIRNIGNAPLTSLPLWIDGLDASAFSITSRPVLPVAGSGGSTTFSVRFAPASLGAKAATMHLSSNDPRLSLVDFLLGGNGTAPAIAVEQAPGSPLDNGGSVSLGQVPVSTTVDLTFTIRNTGNADLTTLSASLDGPAAAAFSLKSLPVSPIPWPNGSTTFMVEFLSPTAGVQTATLHLLSNDPLRDPFNVQLTATAFRPLPSLVVEQAPGISLSNGAPQDFGAITLGGNTNLSFTIRNPGTANLTGLTLSEDGPAASDFAVISQPVVPLLPGATTAFVVQFTPGAPGPRRATLHLLSNDPVQSPFNINLTGTGIPVGVRASDAVDTPLLPVPAAVMLAAVLAVIGAYRATGQASSWAKFQ
jgi:sugar lactone lactonase YvrE